MIHKDHVCNGSPTCPLCNDEGNTLGTELYKRIATDNLIKSSNLPKSNEHTNSFIKSKSIDEQLIQDGKKLRRIRKIKLLIRKLAYREKFWNTILRNLIKEEEKFKVSEHLIVIKKAKEEFKTLIINRH